MKSSSKTFIFLESIKIVPRWLIFAIDIFLSSFAIFLAFLIRNNLVFDSIEWNNIFNTILLACIINSLVFISVKTFRGIVRYTGIKDAIKIFISILISSLILHLVSLYISLDSVNHILPSAIILLYASFSFIFLLGYRVFVKHTFISFKNHSLLKKSVIIFGAGATGVATKKTLENHPKASFNVIAFMDDDKRKQGKSVDGVNVISFNELKETVSLNGVDELIIAVFTISAHRKNELVDFCLDNEINILSVPPYNQWADGSFSLRQLRTIQIEELLERDPIVINNDQIFNEVKGKRILVTGAAGSIGSELVRQLIKFSPELIILCDQAETPLHDLDLELNESHFQVEHITYLANITDLSRIESIFLKYRPQYVYHAAAYKHVPMMEFNPIESVKTNVIGTKMLADLSVKYHVDRFVMISTDKAVNPTNVMGATKRFAEMYVQSLSTLKKETKFITTRFGNVLGSNGSVILRFKEQIEKGGPVTVTHPNITRYFMTIPEACQLVLEAGIMGNGGEVFVFDMGKPIKISDLAKKMIRLYGLVPNIDIPITYSGLRPGEKLYEELLIDGEYTVKTYHEKIMIAKVKEVDFIYINESIDDLSKLILEMSHDQNVVSKIKEVVTEYSSTNSIYLDGNFTKVVGIGK